MDMYKRVHLITIAHVGCLSKVDTYTVVYIYTRPTVRDEYFLLRASEKSVFELLNCPTGQVQIKL